MATLALTALVLLLTTQDAYAQGATLQAVSLPKLSTIVGWFQDPHWGHLPRQAGGTAEGLSHRASAAATHSGKGVGNALGKGRGELDPYHPYAKAAKSGPSRTVDGFAARTSRRNAAKSTQTATVFDNADGTTTRRVTQTPVNYQDASGAWQPIDTRVHTGSDGRWHEAANSVGVDLAATSANGPLASFAADSGHSVSYTLQGVAPVTGTVAGSVVTYANALPGTDVELAPTASGLKEAIVLHSAAAANSWTFPLTLKGLTPVQVKDGSIDLRDGAGKTIERIPAAYAYDSKVDPRSGDPATTHAVAYQLIQQGGSPALRVTLNAGWLHDAARQFPVTVDPIVQDGWTTTYAESGADGDHSSEQTIKVGSYDSGPHSAIGFSNHWYSSFDGTNVTVTAASVHLFDTWAATCTAERFDVALVTSAWTPSGVTTYPGPSHGASIGNLTPSVPNACANSAANRTVGDWLNVPLTTSAIQGWMSGSTTDRGLAIYAATTDALHWKQFGSFNDPNLGPWIDITYTGNAGPQVYQQSPNNNATAHTITPELTAWAGGANAQANTTTKYDFQVYDTTNAKIADSGLVATGNWTVPAGKLAWGRSYYWGVQAYDGGLYSPAPAWYALNIQIPQPVITSGLSQNSSEHGFDATSGNYTTSDTDASISTAGPGLEVVRDYNSRDPRWTGSFGSGWSAITDARVTEQYTPAGAVTSAVVTYPDGSQVGYGKNGDGVTFSPPAGRFATFRAVTGGYTLTDKNDTIYTFTQSLGAGGYGLTSVADANARALTFDWAGGHITQMASAVSGRALHLTWNTPAGAAAPHVATVVTDPVTGTDQATAQTWTYGYTGDQLSSVCAPDTTTECTKYGYTSGSQYQNATLDLDPHAMWPLSEASGSTAKDAILANEGTTNATYSNVNLGQPGPVTGGTATAAGFNGTSSNVVLPNDTGNNTDTGTISLWFKTSAGPGVLYSYASQPITAGNSAGYYTPSLYVGTDGKLNGEFWYSGGMAPITTSAAVTDGKWHHVVLAAAGNSQTLFLDSTKVGSVSGSVSIMSGQGFGMNQPFNYLGAGYLGGKWPDQPHQSDTVKTGYATYFNGSIADVAWYDKPLVAADVSTLYKYGTHAASLLTSTTRPSGKAYATMAYDPATTTLTQVTDENGGVWKLGTPTVSGSSQTYRGAVLGGAPAEYFRLGEVPGASAAVDETRGGNGTYSGVTLGTAGPFTDQQTATFNGTTSRIQIPDAQTGSTSASAEVWFATTHGGGILLNQQSAPIGGTVTSTTPQLWVGSDNKLYGGFYTTSGSVQMVTTGTVTDGKWHHAVLSASPAGQTLYLDGTQAATKTTSALSVSGRSTDYLGAGTTGSGWSGLTNGTVAYFNGSLAEAAVYRSALTAQDAAAHFQAAKNSTGLLPVETVKVVSPADATTTYQYDVENNNRQLSETDGLGNKTSFGYDTGGFEHTVINPNGAMTTTGHDVRGNVVSSTTCQNQAANACSTQYYSYYPDDTTAQLTTADPRNDVLVTERDGRSASATDNTYLTSFSYDTAGDETATTTAPVAGFPSGRTATTVFSDGSASYPAADSGTVPKGLPVRTVSPGGAVNAVSYLHTGDIASTTDAAGLVTSYTYDGLGQVLTKKVVSDTYPAGLKTTYVYDKAGQVVEEDDPQLTDRVTGATHAARTTTVFDGDGNVTSQTVADASGGDTSRTQSQTYDAYDHLASQSDANAAAAASNGNTNTFSYDLSGNKTKEVSSAGTTTQYTYDDNGHLLTQGLMFTGDPVNPSAPTLLTESSRAYDPAGRLASVTDSMGNTTAYTYTDNGLTSTVTKKDAAGTNSFVLQAMTYDAAANPLSQTSDNGATVTNFTVDAASRTTSTTVDPTGVDRVTSVAYTPDDHVATQNDHDSSGWDRTTSSTYDVMGNTLSQTLYGDASGHPAGWWKLDQSAGSTVTDASGTGNTAAVPSSGVTWNNSAATFAGTSTGTGSVIATNSPVLDTSASYSVSAWVNLSDASTYRTFVAQGATTNSSFYLQYSKALNSYTFIAPSSDSASPAAYASAHASAAPALNTWTHLVGVFNAANGAMSLYVNGALAGTGTNTAPWTGNGPMTIGGAKLAGGAVSNVTAGSVGNVQAYPRALTAADITTLYGNGRTGGTVGSSSQQTTKWTYDKRGLPTSMTDANTNTTSYSYDEAGNLAVTTAPTVQVETDGGAPVSTHPVTASGFNTFGEAVEETDPTGNTTTTVYDANGNKVSETLPPYTPAGSSTPIIATSTWAYDSDGNKISSTSPGGKTTSALYDQLGDVAQSTAADGTKTHATYDTNGEKLSVTDATGAVSQATYDYLGRPLTSTTLERFPSTRTLTSTKSYAATAGNPYGANLSSTTTPGGVTSSYGYNRAGDVTSATDGAGNTTQYTYDFQGNRQKTILPDGTWTQTDYNAAGQPASSKQYDVLNNLLKQTSQVYDGVGNITAATDANGNTSRFTYDAAGTVTQEIQPATPTSSITTAFGYDADGNRTRFTDGRGNSWQYAYTPWGQQQSVTEPSTSTYSSPADSTTTNVYDADGQLVSAMSPGGVSTSMTYDQNGALTSASGTAAEAATATRSFTYDNNGQILTADSSEAGITGQKDHQASTHETFGYDDRGDLLSATGSAGSSSFTYNNDAAPLTRADAAGTTSYGYDTAGRMNALSDAATGTALTYGYNSVNQVASVKYGATGQSRTYTYNSAHDLTGDTLVQGAGTLATISYGYDKNGNITSKNTTGVAGASANTYTYDQADRLTGWNNGTVNTAYSYDASGNRTQVGANVYTYDARDQLTSDGVHSYTYSARGTMTSDTSSAGGTVAYTTDAQGNQITAGAHSYTLDATGRNITDANSADTSTRTFQYSGAGNTIASDGNYTYSYDPSGALIGINVNGATSTSTGVLAMTDGHNDVVGTFTSGATTLAGSASYDPTGNTTAKNALSGNLGFQSGWTEADTGKVGTASRWYNPATGTFMNKDSVSLNPVPHSVSANPFAYVNDNPLAGSDPSGQCSWYDAACEARAAYHEVKSAVTTTYTAAAATYHYVAAKVATVVQKAKRTVQKAVNRLHDAYRSTVRYGRRLYAYSSRHARRLYRSAVNHLHSAYHAASSTVHRIVKATKRGATALKKTARKAYTAAVKGAKTAATFVKHHAAAITSFVVSTAVFAGCEALTVGVGSIGCAAIAGAAGSLVEQGFKCAEAGGAACSVGAFAGSAVTGAIAGALGGALGSLGGKLLSKLAPKAMRAVGGLFGKGATEAEETAATDATQSATSKAETDAAGSRSETGGCPTHSFTGNTRVLMANGATKAIDTVKVGDTIANSVPGQTGTQAHTVTAVIVTTTDHDFVDVAIKRSTGSATKAVAKSALKKTVVGLAASAALFATFGATHTAADRPDLSATAPVAAQVNTQTSDHLTTTFHHPFYDETQASFTDAKDLHPGDILQTPTGTAQVTDVRLFHANTTTYDLTIGDLHTYYVLAGATPVLVHNCSVYGKQSYDRATELHKGLWKGAEDGDGGYAFKNDTTAVLKARDAAGNIRSVVASNRPYVPRAIKEQLDAAAGEVYANGKGHAEITALNYIAKNGWELLGGAANRNVCAFCENTVRDVGGSLEGPTFRGRVKTYANGMFSYMGERMFGK